MKKLFLLVVCAFFYSVNCALGALSANLDNVIVYPNPFKAKLGHTQITFDNLTAMSKIKIFKKTGELIYERTVSTTDGRAQWGLTNNDNSNVASGIYIYFITSGDSKCSGKIAVIK